MSFTQIAGIAPNFRDYKNDWLKAYEPGTTTPKPMSDNGTGSPTVSKYQLNADGFPISSGGAVVIPHIDGPYDLWLFPTEAEADANDTINAERLADDISSPGSSIAGYAPVIFDTVADYQAGVTTGGGVVVLSENDTVIITERDNFSFLMTTDISNGTTKIDSTTGLSANIIPKGGVVSLLSCGAVFDGVTDSADALQDAINYTGVNKITSGSSGQVLIEKSITGIDKIEINLNESTTLIRDAATVAYDMIDFNGFNGFKFKNIRIDGVTKLDEAIPANRWCGIRVRNASNFEIEGCYVTKTTSGEQQAEGTRSAITVETCSDFSITQCKSEDNRGTFIYYLDCSNFEVSNNEGTGEVAPFGGTGGAIGSMVSGEHNGNALFCENRCDSFGYTALSINGLDSIVTDNICKNNGFGGITIGDIGPSADSSGSIVSDNICTGNTFEGLFTSGSSNLELANNICRNNTRGGLRMFWQTGTPTMNDVRITGGDYSDNTGYGIKIEGGENHVIEGCDIKDNGDYGVWIDLSETDIGSSIQNPTVRGCHIKDNVGGGVVSTNGTGAYRVRVNCMNNIGETTDAQVTQVRSFWATADTDMECVGNINIGYTSNFYVQNSGGIVDVTNGEPALISGLNLQNGWTASAGTYYWKDSGGVVHLSGNVDTGVAGTVAFILPAGYRPAQTKTWATVANNAFAKLTIDSSGNATPFDSNINHNLDNVSFRAEQ